MVSNLAVCIFVGTFVALLFFGSWCARAKKLHLLHKLYLMLGLAYSAWTIPLILMHFADHGNERVMFILDCFTSLGAFLSPVIYLCIALSFVRNEDHMKKWMYELFIIPFINIIVVFTNPWHHLQYRVFSTIRSEIVFGPYILVTGLYSYLCLIASMVAVTLFAVRNKNRLYTKQAMLFAIGGICPLIVNCMATFGPYELPITATPISFIVPILLNGIAIYQLHLLDIRPIAMQTVLDLISDSYIVISEDKLVIGYNNKFEQVFASKYGISENKYLSECINEEDISKKTAVYNIMSAVNSSIESGSGVSYEQAMTVEQDGVVRKTYYVAEVSPIESYDAICGYAIVFKDITKIKESMKQLQNSQERMMEQERLAFLGQMIGGLAHNLKTPIMGISGCISAEEALVDECEASINDPEVLEEDYREMISEMRDWFEKTKESMAYMSDIITAIKGQAANAINTDTFEFTMDDVIKRCTLLMRHELQSGRCQLITEYDRTKELTLKGNLNNLVQVLNNLLSNAIYSQGKAGGGNIVIKIDWNDEYLNIRVVDKGVGVNPDIKGKLFKSMVTNKGSMGTGLGLYISNAIIRGKFEGKMWMEDNPDKGATFGISIPMEKVTVSEITTEKGGSDEKE